MRRERLSELKLSGVETAAIVARRLAKNTCNKAENRWIGPRRSNRCRDDGALHRAVEDRRQVGEFPFACVIARDGEVVVETTNRVARDGDVTRHAEIVAIGDGAEGARHQGSVGLHALHQRRAVRDVLVPDPRDAHQPRRLFDRLAPDGRGLRNGTSSAIRNSRKVMPRRSATRPRSCAATCGARPRKRGAPGTR